jgi:hypothetical protein
LRRTKFFSQIFSLISRPLNFRFKGQISSRNEIGRWIELLASMDENRVIVEIGAWNGLGSSKMIVRGLRNRKLRDSRTIGFESNRDLYEVAKRNLRRHSDYQLVYGSIVREDELDKSNLTEIEKEWLESDIEDLSEVPFCLDRVPDEIDLLILDGGEFSTFAEFAKLNSRVRNWIVLDDTNTRKCRRILAELSQDSPWIIVFLSDERNGTAILRRSAK